ncbi:MAG: Glu-tRNA(Gln) amidotransferase subunit GatD [Candidatus Aenigmarchaeota archaeon]|nr:Glu-tRNA(Gln) amidotransferase subunit GatD [Candidatus Aenigmarchaeota archaeon]NIP40801.1 Glu-tRNA(Gln) amidotransferase subunit GatD [Candidatus Aenigmarchaeota archaeon]NIQ17915.1 Glu-tRNA(Gln) amidotransferase subunit GatD [Candidatus Aenigmarchaeota archaeon]NIS73504.1 Glu-tRNA(Gln) amidotransferase subunit GatD [Candidatus Aenigmarchaeota archaeon]
MLRRKKIRIGDHVLIEKSRKRYFGMLMPKPEFGDPGTIVIKLDNGYNVGFDVKGLKISKAKFEEPESVEEEMRYELGKTSKSLLKVDFDPRKPKVALISTGGTIISRVDYRTGGVYAVENPKELLHNVPELSKIVNLKMSNPLNKMSEDFDPSDWVSLAKHVARELNSGKKGVIITHGTDTLHYTSAALSFFLKGLRKPVVLVGAQRSSDRGSSDAGMNLVCASHAALSNIGEVGICMHGSTNDDYCLFIRGTHARKMDSERRDAFRSINEYPLAEVWPDGRIEMKNRNYKKRKDNTKVKVDSKFEPKIAILKVYPGADPDVINYYVSKSYKGFVIEATGLGHVPTNGKNEWISTIKKHTANGIPFVTTLQTIYGRINTNVYTNLRILYRDAGAIPGDNMLTEVAFVKLGWILGHTKNMEEIKRMISTNYAGEITKRTLAGHFLY